MRFDELVSALSPRLRQIAARYSRYCPVADADDLFSEMLLFIWAKWKTDGLQGKTESYLVKSCYFHLRNYLRKARETGRVMRFDEPSDERGEREISLAEMIADGAPGMAEFTEGKALYEKIMGNGFTRTEKDIVSFLCEGFTVREIGGMLHISHAMVVKHKKNISRKVTRKYGSLLV